MLTVVTDGGSLGAEAGGFGLGGEDEVVEAGGLGGEGAGDTT